MALQRTDIEAHQDRFLADMETILRELAANGRDRLLMLSGGYDSFVIIAAMRHAAPDLPLRTVTIRGEDGSDADGADAVAAHFRTDHTSRRVTVEEIVDNLHLVKGAGHTSLRRVFSHICYHLALESCGVAGMDVYTGHGGDTLFGNRDALYRDVAAFAKAENLGDDAARTRLKIEYYNKYVGGDLHVDGIVRRLGATARAPFRDPRLAYLVHIPDSIVRPSEKAFVREALRRRYGLGEIAERQRIGMQNGTGLYLPLKARLKEIYRDVGRSSKVIATHLAS